MLPQLLRNLINITQALNDKRTLPTTKQKIYRILSNLMRNNKLYQINSAIYLHKLVDIAIQLGDVDNNNGYIILQNSIAVCTRCDTHG